MRCKEKNRASGLPGRIFRHVLPVLVVAGIYVLSTSEEPVTQNEDTNPLIDVPAPETVISLTAPDDSSVLAWKAPMLLPPEDTTVVEPDYAEIARQMGDFASNYLGVRYRLGAIGPKSFDCSGFTSHIFKNFGLSLNRTSRAQYTQGDKVDLTDVKPGDLLFFSGRRISKNVGHVGMVVSVDPVTGELEMIHASSSNGISIQKFPDNGYFSRRFIGARRYLGTEGFTEAVPKT